MLLSIKSLPVMACIFILAAGQNSCPSITAELDNYYMNIAGNIKGLGDQILSLEKKIESLLAKDADPHKIVDPQLGKSYWFYNTVDQYGEAEKICAENNRELVQLSTLKEHLTINERLIATGHPGCFWTGLKRVAFKDWRWTVEEDRVPNPAARWVNRTVPLSHEGDNAYALGPYLFASDGSDLCSVVCQKESSTKQDTTPKDCEDIRRQSQEATIESGLFLLQARGLLKRRVYCNFSQPETWTTISRRINEEDIFNRTWKEYKTGFGKAGGDYWIGNEMLHQLTEGHRYYLRITMYKGLMGTKISSYKSFKISSEDSDYSLLLGEYDIENSNGGDSFFPTSSDGCNKNIYTSAPFSTYDHGGFLANSCSRTLSGGWWFTDCGCSNLNGKYILGSSVPSSGPTIGLYWDTLYVDSWGFKSSLKKVTMEIRRIKED